MRPLSTDPAIRWRRADKNSDDPPAEVHQISGMQPSRIMKENYGLDPKRLFLCISYRHKVTHEIRLP
jgi:hypothetical protein